MSYRKLMWRYLWGVLVVCSLASCSDDKVVVLPEDDSCLLPFGGSDLAILQGHTFTLGCPLNLSEHARNISVEWDTGSGTFIPEESRQNGMSYITHVWDESGTVSVTCRVSYTYGDERKTLERKQTLGVRPPLYDDCYSYDTMDEVQERYPDAVADDEGSLVRSLADGTTVTYRFSDGRLYEVLTSLELAETGDPYAYFTDAFGQLQYEGTEWKSWKLVQFRFGFLPEDEESRLQTLIGQTERGEAIAAGDKSFVNELFMNGIIGFEASLGKTCGELKYTRLYTYRYLSNVYCWDAQYYFEKPYIAPFNQ